MMQFTTNAFRFDSEVQLMRMVSPPPNGYVGADVCTLPPGVILIRQYAVHRDEWLGRFSLWYEVAA